MPDKFYINTLHCFNVLNDEELWNALWRQKYICTNVLALHIIYPFYDSLNPEKLILVSPLLSRYLPRNATPTRTNTMSPFIRRKMVIVEATALSSWSIASAMVMSFTWPFFTTYCKICRKQSCWYEIRKVLSLELWIYRSLRHIRFNRWFQLDHRRMSCIWK